MNERADWSGPWPVLKLPADLASWAGQRLLLGLEVALLVAVAFAGLAAERAGYRLVSVGSLAVIAMAAMVLVERNHSIRTLVGGNNR